MNEKKILKYKTSALRNQEKLSKHNERNQMLKTETEAAQWGWKYKKK